jgi:hypothetical protein
MPGFLRALNPFSRKDAVQVNRYEGFTGDSRIVLRDRRGTVKAEVPDVDTKAFGMGDELRKGGWDNRRVASMVA